MKRMRDLFQPKKITLDNGKEIQPPRSVAPFILIGLAFALWGAATITGFDFNAL
ncbi:phosphonate ABC transporter, permease protein PhnE, partial [Turicibacter sanguinis]|nr:phosphonate ABC transporter, permease protein PhnE [Turicibacter sanguinis]